MFLHGMWVDDCMDTTAAAIIKCHTIQPSLHTNLSSPHETHYQRSSAEEWTAIMTLMLQGYSVEATRLYSFACMQFDETVRQLTIRLLQNGDAPTHSDARTVCHRQSKRKSWRVSRQTGIHAKVKSDGLINILIGSVAHAIQNRQRMTKNSIGQMKIVKFKRRERERRHKRVVHR